MTTGKSIRAAFCLNQNYVSYLEGPQQSVKLTFFSESNKFGYQ